LIHISRKDYESVLISSVMGNRRKRKFFAFSKKSNIFAVHVLRKNSKRSMIIYED
jgi:hypothetical protein